jgi:Protein of unknown function (DUF3240)
MEQLLVVLVSAAMRDDLIDALIQHEDISGFSLQEMSGFSREHSQYSLNEQVAGYRSMLRFEIQHTDSQESALLALLEQVCRADHARYWIQPLHRTGAIGSAF